MVNKVEEKDSALLSILLKEERGEGGRKGLLLCFLSHSRKRGTEVSALFSETLGKSCYLTSGNMAPPL
eukprot:15367079-Ditylum_brightwellii.AAC.1